MTTPTTPSLTERYVHAAVRTVPEAQRDELARELRERIGDEIDARLAGGGTATPADISSLRPLALIPRSSAACYGSRGRPGPRPGRNGERRGRGQVPPAYTSGRWISIQPSGRASGRKPSDS